MYNDITAVDLSQVINDAPKSDNEITRKYKMPQCLVDLLNLFLPMACILGTIALIIYIAAQF